MKRGSLAAVFLMTADLYALGLPCLELFKRPVSGTIVHSDQFHFDPLLELDIPHSLQHGIDEFFLIVNRNYDRKFHILTIFH